VEDLSAQGAVVIARSLNDENSPILSTGSLPAGLYHLLILHGGGWTRKPLMVMH
jgi:hypothetical protein